MNGHDVWCTHDHLVEHQPLHLPIMSQYYRVGNGTTLYKIEEECCLCGRNVSTSLLLDWPPNEIRLPTVPVRPLTSICNLLSEAQISRSTFQIKVHGGFRHMQSFTWYECRTRWSGYSTRTRAKGTSLWQYKHDLLQVKHKSLHSDLKCWNLSPCNKVGQVAACWSLWEYCMRTRQLPQPSLLPFQSYIAQSKHIFMTRVYLKLWQNFPTCQHGDSATESGGGAAGRIFPRRQAGRKMWSTGQYGWVDSWLGIITVKDNGYHVLPSTPRHKKDFNPSSACHAYHHENNRACGIHALRASVTGENLVRICHFRISYLLGQVFVQCPNSRRVSWLVMVRYETKFVSSGRRVTR